MDLFEQQREQKKAKQAPLAYRMRPRYLDEFVGQEHILGKDKALRRAIESDRITSLILFGPPGTGKTALAHIIATRTKARFERLNAVCASVADLRRLIKEADQHEGMYGASTICLIDEIHRFNKAQQDALLPSVEDGTITLMGITTQNPSFYVIPPLQSRSLIFEFLPLPETALEHILKKALTDPVRGLAEYKIKIDHEALKHLILYAEGDARRALNALEVAVLTTEPGPDGLIHITLPAAEESIQRKALGYEREGDEHYDTISAFIKSMRGSDPDAALYWLAKMLVAGEDPRFIARRIVICASEDMGNADPQALVVATAAAGAVDFVGMPEAQIILAHATTYLATAPKSNAAYLGLNRAKKDIEEGKIMPVPGYLKGTGYKGAARLSRGQGYLYPHDYPGHYVKQAYLPEPRTYYEPTDQGYEARIKEYLTKLKGEVSE